jgi:hypothetical protein
MVSLPIDDHDIRENSVLCGDIQYSSLSTS